MTDSPMCSFCKDDLETIEHIFAAAILLKKYGVTLNNAFQINFIGISASTENQSSLDLLNKLNEEF